MRRTILKLFPPYLTLVANYPLLLGLIFNHSLVDGNLFIINILWQTIFVILFRALRSTTLYRIGVFLYGITSFLEGLHWIILKSPLSHSSLFVIAATNLQESVDFMGIKAGLGLLCIIPLFLLIYLAYKQKPNFEPIPKAYYIQGVTLLVFLGFLIDNALAKRFVRKGIPQFAKVAVTFYSEMQLFKQAKQENFTRNVEAKATENSQTLVLIMGESANRNHWQLYGNQRNNTPHLGERHDLFVFHNVVSAYSNTIASVLSSLSESALNNDISLSDAVDIFDVFTSAGYSTYWIFNQPPIGVWENLATIFARKAHHTFFVNLAGSSSMESTLTRSYDELLFEPTLKAMQSPDSLRFIVIHTMGNHLSYKKRYPPRFNKFKGNDSKTRTIAEYHNSILYHDYVVDSLLKIVERNAMNAVVLYTSDHGQNVYDEGEVVGHTHAGRLPKANVEVPFFIWFSEQYGKGVDLGLIKSRAHFPYVTDNLFHTLIDLAKIETPVFRTQESLVNAGYDKSRKRILEDEFDYDE